MNALLYIGLSLIIGWGIAHLVVTGSMVKSFGNITNDNRRIITMEWLAEGLAMIFIGGLVLMVILLDGTGISVGRWVIMASTIMLLIMAILTQMTGARTSIVAIKICPWVKTLVAILFFVFIIWSGAN
jgi:amino acid transporter